jgi:hypothetical protein
MLGKNSKCGGPGAWRQFEWSRVDQEFGDYFKYNGKSV